MVLTKEWQTIATYQVLHDTGFNCTFYLDAKYSGQSTANITTTFQTRLRSVVNSGSGVGAPYKFTLSYANDVQGSGLWTYATETIAEGQGTVRHNEDGTKSITLSATMFVSASLEKYKLNASMSATVDLPTIDRYPIISSATDFNDTENPTITYTTNVGFQNATTYACISLDETTDNIEYRQVNISDGTYTFSLTTAERNILRNATPNSNTLNVYFILKTVVGNTNYFSKVQRQMTIVNANPTYTHTEVETVQKVINILGSSASSVIQNASVMRVTIVPTALKGSSIANVKITSGTEYERTITTSPYVFDIPIVSTGSFVLKVTDSRGNHSGTAISKTYITYNPVSFAQFTFERYNPTSSNIIINFEGNYIQKNFSSTANVPTIKWKLDNGSYTTIPSSNYVIDTTNNKIKINNYELSNVLNYKNKGTFSIELSDLLTSASDSQEVIAGIPTFDYGEHDLKVNGDLFIADEDGENKINVLNELSKIEDLLPSIEYSETEQIVGKWINNEPIYRKVIYVYSLPDNSTTTVPININNLEDFVSIRGVASNGNYFFTLPSYRENDAGGIEMWVDTTNGITIKTGQDRTSYHANIILEYTKTS